MMIDSGASANIVDEAQWKHLKSKGIKCTSSTHVSKPLYRYGSTERSLKVLGKFHCNAKLADRELPIDVVENYTKDLALLPKILATHMKNIKNRLLGY